MEFKELGLSPELLKSVEHAGFEEAALIQAEAIPLVLTGKNVIEQAQTGTGETTAFGLPVLKKIDPDRHEPQGLVTAPIRELATQTQEGLYRLRHNKKVRVQAVYGEAGIGCQIRDLKDRLHIVVGIPGCMLDHINHHTLRLGTVQTLVLDGTDEMLNMGFLENIEKITSQVPDQRRASLFSATVPPTIKNTGVKLMKNPYHVKIKTKEMTADLADQYYVHAKGHEKFDIMTRLFDVQTLELTIVFGHIKRRVNELTHGLEACGYRAEGIHGDLSQQERMSILRSFKSGHLDILVAADIAACGLDISGVIRAYNYDIPQDPEDYVHHIGRTDRAGRGGVFVTFITLNKIDYLHVIENLMKKRMTTLCPPAEKEAFKGQLGVAVEQTEIKLAEDGLDKYLQTADKLLEERSVQDLVVLLLKTITKNPVGAVPVKITPERPLSMQKKGYNKNGKRGGGNSCNRRDGGNYHGNESEGGYSKNNNSQKGGGERHNDRKRGFIIRLSNDWT